MRVLLVAANREILPSPVIPLGVLTVAASLRAPRGDEPGHEVELCDLCFEADPLAAAREAVRRVKPDLVGIGLRNLHTNAYDGTEGLLAEYKRVAEALREATRELEAERGRAVPFVVGGSGFSLQPETLLDLLGCEHGVIGEGERAFRELVDAIARGETPPKLVQGAYVSNKAPIILRAGQKRRSDLDELPLPARDLVDPRYYEFDGTDNVQTKRGCAFQCAYCDYPDLEGRKVRMRDPAEVADEVLARASVPGVSHVFFVDSVFNVPRSHALAVCDELIARGSPLPWVCYGSPVSFDDVLVERMARAGCQGVEIGSDSGSEKILKRLRKPFGLREIVETKDLFRKHGLVDCHTFVLGAEGETADEVRESLDFIASLDPDVAVFIVFMEDRESHTPRMAEHRAAILELLTEQAPLHEGWVVPELGIRFGRKISEIVKRMHLRGPSWLHLARQRRHGWRGVMSAKGAVAAEARPGSRLVLPHTPGLAVG
jgi:tRNA A37 methylthiotransferase MiaB